MNACSKSLPLLLCDNVRFDVHHLLLEHPARRRLPGLRRAAGLLRRCSSPAPSWPTSSAWTTSRSSRRTACARGSMLEILRCLGEGREGTPQEVFELRPRAGARAGRRRMIELGRRRRRATIPTCGSARAWRSSSRAPGLPGIDSANATVDLLGDGTFMLLSGGTDLGTGLDTLIVKLVAECLCTRHGGRLADRRPTPTSRPTTTAPTPRAARSSRATRRSTRRRR